MTKFHVNSAGQTGKCRATIQCPYGGEEDHYESKKDAMRGYESYRESLTIGKIRGIQTADEAKKLRSLIEKSYKTALKEFAPFKIHPLELPKNSIDKGAQEELLILQTAYQDADHRERELGGAGMEEFELPANANPDYYGETGMLVPNLDYRVENGELVNWKNETMCETCSCSATSHYSACSCTQKNCGCYISGPSRSRNRRLPGQG